MEKAASSLTVTIKAIEYALKIHGCYGHLHEIWMEGKTRHTRHSAVLVVRVTLSITDFMQTSGLDFNQ